MFLFSHYVWLSMLELDNDYLLLCFSFFGFKILGFRWLVKMKVGKNAYSLGFFLVVNYAFIRRNHQCRSTGAFPWSKQTKTKAYPKIRLSQSKGALRLSCPWRHKILLLLAKIVNWPLLRSLLKFLLLGRSWWPRISMGISLPKHHARDSID